MTFIKRLRSINEVFTKMRKNIAKRLTVGGDKFIADALLSCGPMLECLRSVKIKNFLNEYRFFFLFHDEISVKTRATK